MKLKIKYSKKFEFERIKYTLKKLDWYTKQGYNVKLPKGIIKDSTNAEILNQIKKEYNVQKYKKAVDKIKSGYFPIKDQFSNAVKKYFKNAPNFLIINLTNYGVGGSYDLPNEIIANISQVNGYYLIVHETIHLLVERNIMKYKVEHWEKERIVDLILNSKEFGFLKYDFFESDSHGNWKSLDKLFNKYFFKDQKMFFEKIKDVRK